MQSICRDKQESIPIGRILSASANNACFNSHQMSALDESLKFELVSHGDHQMSLVWGPCHIRFRFWVGEGSGVRGPFLVRFHVQVRRDGLGPGRGETGPVLCVPMHHG